MSSPPFRHIARPARLDDECGFTLIEVLVAVMIIGVLAAIALPTFLGQQTKGQDAAAKSDARNLLSHVESCYTDGQDYRNCTSIKQLNGGAGTGLSIGTNAGEVDMTADAADSYVITGHSRSGNDFLITKTASGAPVRTCTKSGNGGCRSGGKAGGIW